MRLFFAAFFLLLPALLTGQERAPLYYRMARTEFLELPDLHAPMNLSAPDYELLDAALFHATNEVRATHGLPPFRYDPVLFEAAAYHATTMISRNFYDHLNKTGAAYHTPDKRIRTFGGDYHATAENIAQFPTVDMPRQYCPRQQSDRTYRYFDCRTGKAFRPFTYAAFARMSVQKWMASPGHRANILNDDLTFLACAARLSRNPYGSRSAPFARPVQNFGGYLFRHEPRASARESRD